jgi:hypothetical protein
MSPRRISDATTAVPPLDKTPLETPLEQPAAPPADVPPATESMEQVRRLVGAPYRGSVKIVRRYASVGIALWKIEAALRQSSGPDYELEVEGASLDEVAFTLLEALQQLGFSHDAGG